MTDDKNKMSVIHHVVYSTKGGCGKTTFSLFLTLSRFIKETTGLLQPGDRFDIKDGKITPGKDSEDKIQPDWVKDKKFIKYYMDVDFLGTSIMAVTGEEDFDLTESPETAAKLDSDQLITLTNNNVSSTPSKPVTKKFVRMNDLIFNDEDVRNIYSSADNRENGVYIIPSSAYEADKERFHVKRRFTPLLRYDEFVHEIRAIVDSILLTENVRAELKSDGTPADNIVNFIYDMPPNSDGYTEALFDYLSGQAKEKHVEVVLYLVYNNHAMLVSNLEWLRRFTSSGKDIKFKCCLVYNNTDNGNAMTNSSDDMKRSLEADERAKNILDSDFSYIYSSYDECVRDFYNSKNNDKPQTSVLNTLFAGYRD
ncbi:MAG: hypothetical protein LUD72_04450 [Bacteroidales bacterium]|nr:hypothetical protein [Bacteroidales bacterium]